MKKNIFIKGFAAAALVATMGSCSSDYLDLKPITSIDASTVTSTVEGARLGLYGVCRTMWWPESAFGAGQRFIQGEAAVSTFYGDLFSPDIFYNVWSGYGVEYFRWQYMRDSGTWIPGIGWKYYYNLISMSNRILDDIDDAEGDVNERNFVKAQLLTMRAHAYTRLVQIFAPRWENSNGGEAYCMVLRTKFETKDTPLVTMNTILAQIYSDLDTALALYSSCGLGRTYSWEPDASVAYGVYARAAATRHDWAKCRDMARLAYQRNPIMTAEQYCGGFADGNGEWIWYNAPDVEGVYYWSWGAMYACNGAYTVFWGNYGAGAINYDLIRQLHAGDIRKTLYLVPDFINDYKEYGPMPTRANFWNKSKLDPTNMNVNGSDSKMQFYAQVFGESKTPSAFQGDVYKPYTPDASEEGAASSVCIPFGAQYKFFGHGEYSISSFPFMRGSEFALLEAEACYRLQDEAGAQAALTAVNSKRFDNGYTCSYTGEDLWNEIMLTSRIELWGEGHSWYNLKRWNIDVERKGWEAGDTNSNNFPAKFAFTFPKDMNKGWSYIVPNSEFRYNHDVDMSLLQQ